MGKLNVRKVTVLQRYFVSTTRGTLFVLIWIIAAVLVVGGSTLAQTNFERMSEEPIIPVGSAGDWDSGRAGYQCLLVVGDTYHMWYSGDDDIGHATSDDGLAWTKDTVNNPVLVRGASGTWDDTRVIGPYVIHDGEIFHMWYVGYSSYSGYGIGSVGYATSPDGVVWTKDDANNPVMESGSPGSWDELWVAPDTVLFLEGLYRMWFQGSNSGYTIQIGYAESDDGVTWIKDSEPVFGPSNQGSCFDAALVHFADVHFNGNSFQMWYAGYTWDGNENIGYATSPDGMTWDRYGCDPIFGLGDSGNWDDTDVYVPRVLHLDSGYHLYYTGHSEGLFQTGYAFDPGISGTDINRGLLPGLASLNHAYPNPFNPMTTIEFSLSDEEWVSVSVFDMAGRKVSILVDRVFSRGDHAIGWDGRNTQGRAMPSGTYLIRLATKSKTQSRKVSLLR